MTMFTVSAFRPHQRQHTLPDGGGRSPRPSLFEDHVVLVKNLDPDLCSAGQRLVGAVDQPAAALNLDLAGVSIRLARLDGEDRVAVSTLGVGADHVLINVNASELAH